MGDFKKLKAWQVADDMVVAVYQHTKGFPSDERYGLTSQVRRAAVSVASNIAEGAGRNSTPEFRRFLRIALGSANEVAYQIHLAARLGYLADAKAIELAASAESVKRLVAALTTSLGSE